jgi:hypothetical protein
MRRRAVRLTLGCFGAVALVCATPRAAQNQACLHEEAESPADRARRTAALRLTRQINNTQVNIHQQTGVYPSISYLAPDAIPEGYVLKAATEGQRYLFVLTDASDPCRAGYLSSEDGIIAVIRALR